MHLATPHLFINIGVRFIRNDGSTSDVLSGNDIEIRSRGQTISMVIQERGNVTRKFLSIWKYFEFTKCSMLSIKSFISEDKTSRAIIAAFLAWIYLIISEN